MFGVAKTQRVLLGLKRNLKRLEDADLVALYKRKQDLNVCAELFKRYSQQVLGIALKYFKNLPDAEDSSMDIFIELKTKLLQYPVENFKPWLLTLARNHCLMKLRKAKPEIVQLDGHEENEEDMVHSEEELHHKNASEEELLKHLGELPDEQKQCLELFYYQQMSYEDIAAKKDMSKASVRSAIQSGRNRLKRRMNNSS